MALSLIWSACMNNIGNLEWPDFLRWLFYNWTRYRYHRVRGWESKNRNKTPKIWMNTSDKRLLVYNLRVACENAFRRFSDEEAKTRNCIKHFFPSKSKWLRSKSDIWIFNVITKTSWIICVTPFGHMWSGLLMFLMRKCHFPLHMFIFENGYRRRVKRRKPTGNTNGEKPIKWVNSAADKIYLRIELSLFMPNW